MRQRDRELLRRLAEQYVEACAQSIQAERRTLWRQHNSLRNTRPLIFVRRFAWHEMPHSQCICEDALARQYETFFRKHLFSNTFDDDSILEPWVSVQARRTCTGWGLSPKQQFTDEPGGSFKEDYPLKELWDIEKLRAPRHEIDEEGTSEIVEQLTLAIGDIITINVDRGPAYRGFTGDISTDLGHLRGIEHFMVDMIDNPEWLHGLVKFMRDGILKVHGEAESAGDWGLSAHQNQAMPYAEELDDPAANVNGVARKQLWCFMAAQELTAVSPAMHNEFILEYQLPILKEFGLVAYGCCEDLTDKIDMLRQIPNLRRIAVSPFADVAHCAEQIGREYVLSYRPSPADMVGYGFNPTRIRSILSRDLAACKDCHVDITLKDVETVEGDSERVKKWVTLTREVVDQIFG